MTKEIIDIVADIRNKLSPFSNILALLEAEKNELTESTIIDIILIELDMCKKNMPIIKAQLEQINRIVEPNL